MDQSQSLILEFWDEGLIRKYPKFHEKYDRRRVRFPVNHLTIDPSDKNAKHCWIRILKIETLGLAFLEISIEGSVGKRGIVA